MNTRTENHIHWQRESMCYSLYFFVTSAAQQNNNVSLFCHRL